MERTLILAKPDAYARHLSGEILARFERKGLRPVALRVMTMTRELAERHYAEHVEQAVLRRARRFHHLRPARRDGARRRLRGRGSAPGDRRHQPARGRARLDPRRLRDRRPARTSCTAPTARSPRRARSGSSSRSLRASWSRGNQLVLASRSPQRRAILDGLGVGVRRARAARRGVRERARLSAVALRKRAGQGDAPCARRRTRSCSGSTRSSRSTGGCAASRRTRRRRARRSRRCRARTHTVVSGLALLGPDEAPRTATCATAVTLPRARRRRRSSWYVGDRRVARARRRLRDPGGRLRAGRRDRRRLDQRRRPAVATLLAAAIPALAGVWHTSSRSTVRNRGGICSAILQRSRGLVGAARPRPGVRYTADARTGASSVQPSPARRRAGGAACPLRSTSCELPPRWVSSAT